MTYKELIEESYPVLEQISNLQGTTFKFDYWLGKNIDHIKPIYKRFLKGIGEINIKFTQKNPDGSPKTENNTYGQPAYVFGDNKEKRDAEVLKYNKEYEVEIDPKEFEVYKLKIVEWEANKVKVQGLTANHFIKLRDFIDIPEDYDKEVKPQEVKLKKK